MSRTVLVIGRSGQVARALSAQRSPDLSFAAIGRPDLDLSRFHGIASAIETVISATRPVVLVNAAAYTDVDRAEAEPDAAYLLNRDAAGVLAAAAARHGLPIVHLSTDYVFAGDKPGAYAEIDETGPLGVYGRSKVAGEAAVAAANANHAILRTAWIYGPHGSNFLKTMLRLASANDRVRVVADQWGTPTYAPDLADAIAAVVRGLLAEPTQERLRGVFHVVAEGETSRAGFAAEIFRQSARLGGASVVVEPVATKDYPTPAFRPANSRLCTRRFKEAFGHALPPWEDGVARCLEALGR